MNGDALPRQWCFKRVRTASIVNETLGDALEKEKAAVRRTSSKLGGSHVTR